MKAIYKYNAGDYSITMPKDAQILDVQMQYDIPQLWALVDTSNEMETREFLIMGTGMEFDDEGSIYIGTFQQFGGDLVWHLFEYKEESDNGNQD